MGLRAQYETFSYFYFREYNSYQKGQIFLIFFWGEGLEVLIIVHILYLCVTLTRSCTKYLSWLGMERDNITYLDKSKILMLVFSLVLFRRGPWNCACWQHPLSFMCSLVVLTYSKGCRIFFFFFWRSYIYKFWMQVNCAFTLLVQFDMCYAFTFLVMFGMCLSFENAVQILSWNHAHTQIESNAFNKWITA